MNHNFILFDSDEWIDLLPLTYTRPIAELKTGIFTIRQKWEFLLNHKISFLTKDYLSRKFTTHLQDENIFINGSLIPDQKLIDHISTLTLNSGFTNQGKLVIVRLDKKLSAEFIRDNIKFNLNNIHINEIFNINKINYLWDLFQKADMEIRIDFGLLTKDRNSEKHSRTNTLIGDSDSIFLEPGAKIESSVINTSTGPVYISKNAEIMEGCMIRGPFHMDENATLKMGSKIYGAVSLGKHCKVGGEVNNSIFMDYSNKAHDGFIGNSVLGEWCNLGADTNNSNLKNNYAIVKLWSYKKSSFVSTGQQFCGLFMGDHSKAGINTMFNTGTIVGVSANIFGAGFPRNFVPSFSWGGNHGFTTFEIDKALETAQIMMARRHISMDDNEKAILVHIFEETAKNRIWERK